MTFIKRHKILSLILFLTPAIIIILLRILDWQSCFHITSADWITLISGLFTYYGTVILAVVTVSQNDKLIEFQERQERREQLQDERDERQERREERQEERDNINQEIASRQLEIAERQKEIADRQLKYVERDQEITETILRDEYQPNFAIAVLKKPQNGIEAPVDLERQMLIRGYVHEFKAWMDAEEKLNTLYVTFKNESKIDAYDVSIAEVEHKFWFDKDEVQFKDIKERQNPYYKNLFILTFDHIPPEDCKVMTYVLSEDEAEFAVKYTMTFRNAYHHWYYQDIAICIGRKENKIGCQLQINDSKQGKKEVFEHGIVKYKDGTFLQFPPENNRLWTDG